MLGSVWVFIEWVEGDIYIYIYIYIYMDRDR